MVTSNGYLFIIALRDIEDALREVVGTPLTQVTSARSVCPEWCTVIRCTSTQCIVRTTPF